MHEKYHIPHIVITSVSLAHPEHPDFTLCVVGSTMTSDRRPRAFKIVFSAIDAYFSGTGDMFAALMVVRMREAVHRTPGLRGAASWVSADGVGALELPLARAAEKVLASMHEVLAKTAEGMGVEMQRARAAASAAAAAHGGTASEEDERTLRLRRSKACELRLVRNIDALKFPTVELRAVPV